MTEADQVALRRLAGANRLGCWICLPARAGCRWGFNGPGFRIDGAVEIDPLAARTHARNFHPGDEPGVPRDITATGAR